MDTNATKWLIYYKYGQNPETRLMGHLIIANRV